MDKKEIDVSGFCQLSELSEIILQKLTELNIENNRFISVTYNLAMEKYPYLRLGFCKFSRFKKHMKKGIETIHQRLTELNAENHKITSVSYELSIEVE
ncbi:hypothetical protein ES703_109685 [subsurface metagenome]